MTRSIAIAILAGGLLLPAPVRAQITRADSAAILVEAARRLEAEGQRAAADAVLNYVLRHFGGTVSAAFADSLLGVRLAEPERAGSGRVQLIAWSTLYGAWLGIAVPAMLDSEEPAAYGIGLLLGGPAGFGAAREYSSRFQPTLGQTAAMTFGFRWGTWQAVGWRAALSTGDGAVSGWTAVVLGGVGGMTAGAIAGNRLDPSLGRVSFASHSAYWGTYYGAVFASLTDQDGDGALTMTLLAGDLAFIAGAMAGPADVSASRVWLTSAMGIGGVAAGFGIDLLIQPDDDKVILTIPAITGALALAGGWQLTRDLDRRRRTAGGIGGGATALLERCSACGDGARPAWRLNLPAPQPGVMVLGENARGRRVLRPALTVRLLDAAF